MSIIWLCHTNESIHFYPSTRLSRSFAKPFRNRFPLFYSNLRTVYPILVMLQLIDLFSITSICIKVIVLQSEETIYLVSFDIVIYHQPFFETLNFCQCNSFSWISSNSVRYSHFLCTENTIVRSREPSKKHSFNKQPHYAYFTFCASMQSMYFCIASSLPIPTSLPSSPYQTFQGIPCIPFRLLLCFKHMQYPYSKSKDTRRWNVAITDRSLLE